MLVRDVLPTLNNGQFIQLLPLFSDETNRLFYYMTIEQAVNYHDAILEEDRSLLMRVFLGELAAIHRRNEGHERPLKHAKMGEEEDLTLSPAPVAPKAVLIPNLVFEPVSQIPPKQYGLSSQDLTRALTKQLNRFMDHVTKPINLERNGPKITQETAEEQRSTFLRYAGFLVNIKGADSHMISIQHALLQDLVVEYFEWMDLLRGLSTGNCRKVIQHLTYIANFALVLFPPLKVEYGDVPDVYRRLAAQLSVIEKQQSMTQSDLMREGSWLPYPIIVELASNRVVALEDVIRGGESRKRCSELALQAVIMMLLSRRNWRTIELTSLELVSEKQLEALARTAGLPQSAYLEACGRNFIIHSLGKWVVFSNAFKTVGSQRHLEDTLTPPEAKAMDAYVGYRNELLKGNSHCFAFVGPTGRQLTGTEIADMFEQLTGVRLLCNVRRKATITWALAQPNMDRESLARLCRHSELQQRRVYDQRGNDVRTAPVLSAIEGLASSLGQSQPEEPTLEVNIGDIIRYRTGGSNRVGKVVDVGVRQELVVMSLVEETIQDVIHFKPIFGDSLLLSQLPIYEHVDAVLVISKLH